MDLGALELFKGIASKMAWLTQRQNVIAQNIANVDTPDYQAQDLATLDFKETLKATMAPERTNKMHMAGLHSGGATAAKAEKKPYELTPSGNSVSVEEQMQKAASTGIDYQMITTLYQKNIGLIKAALGHGNG
jgi:flagellar basal-body rod protein FlgB